MVKDMRYIIKKIIIGVGIALAIMCIKTNVFAAGVEYETGYGILIGPNGFCYNTSSNASCPSISTFYDGRVNTNFYGRDFGASTGIGGVSWYIPVNGAVDNTAFDNAVGDMTFVMIAGSAQSNADIPYNFVVTGVTTKTTYSCNSDSSLIHDPTNTGQYNETRKYTSVRCQNIPLSQDYRIQQTNSVFYVAQVGITAPTWTLSIKDSNNQAVVNAINETNSTIKDSSVDNDKASSDIETMKGKVANNGTITQLLTLPITLYQAILNSVNGSCSSYSLGSLLGTNLTLPCINLQSYLGSTIWGIIDMVCSGLFILVFRKKMVDIFNHMTSLNDRGNELE